MYILSDKTVTTRKAHICNACLREYPAGTRMRTQVNNSDGIIIWRECPTCRELLSDHREKFKNDWDSLCNEGCVNEACEDKGLTPEELLELLNKEEKK